MEPDQVARWNKLKERYQTASYSFGTNGLCYGVLRASDVPMRALSLKQLIDDLLAREDTGAQDTDAR